MRTFDVALAAVVAAALVVITVGIEGDADARSEEEACRRVAEARVRIARDLHDSIAHSLASSSVQAGSEPMCRTDDRRTVSISLGHRLAGVGGRFGQQIQVGRELFDCHLD